MKYILLTIHAFLHMAIASAQDDKKLPEISADLSDETEETEVIDKQALQVEAGILFNRYDTDPASVIGQVMLRYGLAKNIEVRVLVEDGRNRDVYLESTVQSTSPLAIGAKAALLQDHDWLPDISILGYIKLPFTNKQQYQQAYWSPMLQLAFQHAWNGERWKLDYNVGAQQQPFSTEWTALGNASLHYHITQPLETFVEYYAQYQPLHNPQHNVGLGFNMQFSKNTAGYITAGTTVATSEPNQFAAAGFAFIFR